VLMYSPARRGGERDRHRQSNKPRASEVREGHGTRRSASGRRAMNVWDVSSPVASGPSLGTAWWSATQSA
jgi:hypothetical protein